MIELSLKNFNANAFYLMHYLTDEAVRFIILYGGSSSAKSYSEAQAISLQTFKDGENTLVMRKVGASIAKTIYEDYRSAIGGLHITGCKFVQNCIRFPNGARIDFSGLDDPEKIKGISNYKRIVLEEWSEFDEADFKQLRKRLRGKKGQQIICTFNPISESHWIKKSFFDTQEWHDVPMLVEIDGAKIPEHLCKVKSLRMNASRMVMNSRTGVMEEHAPDAVAIQSTYLNNFWVVGSPNGKYGYYDEQCIADFEHDRLHDPDYYNVYALGEWGVIRTGSEFFPMFSRGVHCGSHPYDSSLPVHVSVDNNALPYITFTLWQCRITPERTDVWQFAEYMAEPPMNSVRKAAKELAARLHAMGVDSIILHGDASTRASNTFDDEKRSWLDLLVASLEGNGIEVEDRVGNKNPSVAMSGEFINAIFDGQIAGLSISIDDSCGVSIEDYMAVQKDANGAILKTRVKDSVSKNAYEAHGHASDTFRYFVCDVLGREFTEFSNRRKRNMYSKDGAIQFFNGDTEHAYEERLLYIIPNINGKFVCLDARSVGELWHIVGAVMEDSLGDEQIRTAVLGNECDAVFECSDAYFPTIRALREEGASIRVQKDSGADYVRRIMATADFVKSRIRFSVSEYPNFLDALMDYRQGGKEDIEASAAVSGLAQYIAKRY